MIIPKTLTFKFPELNIAMNNIIKNAISFAEKEILFQVRGSIQYKDR